MSVLVKICGLAEADGLDAAVEAGADFAGFVFYPGSPRAIAPAAAADLADALPDEITKVGLFVDPTDYELDEVLRQFRLDLVQLHGGETPERVDQIRLEFGLPVMKAIGVADTADVERALAYEDHADWLLFDAKPVAADTRPGGLGRSFPWHLLQDWRGETPWMLAGGLTPENVERAVAESGAGAVDVSSGVESAPGVKDPARIAAFLRAAKNARASW
ncbi:N-(5'-phosphoribosyl)anthranilate isomerase [uncultured Alphaproteobacteria bacterium]|uniref:N-(5'-phosphoribosyl)anthranilate isomerase n=1 Tax=uncultured Alphaproteobacteria bacterium TaxID=91750 RepID=A0A212KKF7_9PROT|nr:N-(5'-phosphoribosyl)anthranilate isomerase [uncultured Alphaproteobacteria bacterium]